jgi:hypothetical protein
MTWFFRRTWTILFYGVSDRCIHTSFSNDLSTWGLMLATVNGEILLLPLRVSTTVSILSSSGLDSNISAPSCGLPKSNGVHTDWCGIFRAAHAGPNSSWLLTRASRQGRVPLEWTVSFWSSTAEPVPKTTGLVQSSFAYSDRNQWQRYRIYVASCQVNQ